MASNHFIKPLINYSTVRHRITYLQDKVLQAVKALDYKF
jgi:hypothetical protein